MAENQNISKEIYNNKLSYAENLILDLFQSYTYDDIMNYLFDENNIIVDDNLKNKLKELTSKIDIEELSRLLTKDEINKLLLTQKNEGNNLQNQEDIIDNISENQLNLDEETQMKKSRRKRKKRVKVKKEKHKPLISKILYRKNNNDCIYVYRYVTIKKGNIYLLRCQDKYCKSKASYNYETKEICIYEEHSKDILNHIYLSERTQDNMKELISNMLENKEILSMEIFSDNSKQIINNIHETYHLKKENEININEDNDLLLNKKRNDSNKKFKIIKSLGKINKGCVTKFNTKKIINKKKTIFFKTKNTIGNFKKTQRKKDIENLVKEQNLNNSQIINLNEEEEIINQNKNPKEDDSLKEEFVNKSENYCEIKDKYIKHNMLLTKDEQLCFGENRRLGTHFHKENSGKIYNYFGNNKEIKDFNMIYRCILKGCKSKAQYNLKTRTFTILKEHTRPYEEHYCSNPNDNKTKEWVNYLKTNENLSDLQIILI